MDTPASIAGAAAEATAAPRSAVGTRKMPSVLELSAAIGKEHPVALATPPGEGIAPHGGEESSAEKTGGMEERARRRANGRSLRKSQQLVKERQETRRMAVGVLLLPRISTQVS